MKIEEWAPWAIGAAALWFFFNDKGAKPPMIPNPVPDFGGARGFVVNRALREFERVDALPAGEHANPKDYWDVAVPSAKLSPSELANLDWCGGFYLWAVKAVGLAPDLEWRFDGTGLHGALPVTADPKPGDLAYFNKNQHHALIESIDGDTVNIINGNGGGKGITRSTVKRSQVAAFFSLDPIIAAASVV